MKDTRERLVAAAERVLRERGLAHLSTREVARAAKVAEGALYHHFADKNELLLAVMRRYSPQYLEEVRELPLRVGQRTVRENLVQLVRTIYEFHRHAIPITCSLFSDTELLVTHRRRVRASNAGPSRVLETIEVYLQAEQRLGRLAVKADVEATATLLVGAGFQTAFLEAHWGKKRSQADLRRHFDALVGTLLAGVEG